MSIQTIIDRASSIAFDRRRISAQSISRSQRIKTSERAAAQPMQLTVTPPAMMRYSQSRQIIEAIQTNDKVIETQINLANNPKLSYLTDYQGRLTSGQLSALTITNFTVTSVTIGGLPSVSAGTVIFSPGDFIQPTNSRYPYIVTNTVTRGTNTVVTATVHRPAITSEGISLTTPLRIGNSCTFQLIVATLPTYRIVPYDLMEWRDDFVLIEKII
jgi:hypothetical protein